MAKGKVTVKSLRAGQTVYRVSGRGPCASISKLLITSRPYRYKNKDSVLNGTLWVDFRMFYDKDRMFKILRLPEYREDNFSLRDAGIVQDNDLNRTFYTYKAAKRWCEYAQKQPEINWDDDYDMWSPMDSCEWDHSPVD